LRIDCKFSIPAKVVIEVLTDCIGLYGIPGIIRTDQGPEFQSLTFQKFIQKYGIRHEFIEKGSPWQNGMIESFNGKLRDECLNRNLFENPVQAKDIIQKDHTAVLEVKHLMRFLSRMHNYIVSVSGCVIFKKPCIHIYLVPENGGHIRNYISVKSVMNRSCVEILPL